uniref:Renalase n=1 Tax=Pavo cristatus TaxID=9049 RepID=A0A8C9F8G2_PAVCR
MSRKNRAVPKSGDTPPPEASYLHRDIISQVSACAHFLQSGFISAAGGTGWCCRYLFNSRLERDSPEIGPSVVVHTTVTFGREHLYSDPAEVQQLILSHLESLVSSLPKAASVKCQKWRYSQVTKAVPNCPRQMILHTQPLLICGGDGFTCSNFDGCIESALSLAETVRSHL